MSGARSDTPDVEAFREREFELKTALSEGGSATAYRRKWNGSAWVTTTTEFTVYDSLEMFSGEEEATGWATFQKESNRWVVRQLRCS